jgi:hypothetical protein
MPLILSSGWQRQIFKLAQAGRGISVLVFPGECLKPGTGWRSEGNSNFSTA